MLLPVLRQIEQKALVERSARSLRRAARVSSMQRLYGAPLKGAPGKPGGRNSVIV
jgi:hypothetical protein